MLASLNFVEKFISLPKKNYDVCINGKQITKTIYDTTYIAPILTRQGFEVESIRQFGGDFDTVVVGRIERFEQHPDANRLNICFVNLNDSSGQLRQIVCGARNVATGMYVAVALPGTKLPVVSKDTLNKPHNDSPPTFEIKSSIIRNVQSDGMLCARSELGLSVNAHVDGDGIWDLANDAQGGACAEYLEKHLGFPVFATLGLEDTLLELSVTPNRADMLCQQGVARELAAGFKYNQIEYKTKSFDFSNRSDSTISAQKILSDAAQNAQGNCNGITFEACNYLQAKAFFVLIELTQTQAHTPAWLRNLMEPLNQNSINLIVDISNFILVAYGQPNHTFDLDSLDPENTTHKKLILRYAQPNEYFVGLDGKERTLHETDCVVSDSKTPHALLGVVGGEQSKIKSNTRRIAVEFANPNPVAVRHTARRHSKHTVASFIFEKGIDVGARFHAAAEFTALLSHLNHNNIQYCTSVHSKNLECNPIVQTMFPTKWLPLQPTDQKRILGTDLVPFDTQLDILNALGFAVQNNNNNNVHMLSVPSWRLNDVVDTADLVEEFIRVVGIDHVPPIPMDISATVNNDDVHFPLIQKMSDQLCALGYNEVAGLNFMRTDDYQKLNLPSADALGIPVAIVNPVLGDEPLMQTTLIPDLLRKVERNLNYGVKSGQLFCSARTFQHINNTPHPAEVQKFAGVCFGPKTSKNWQNSAPQEWTLQDIMMHLKTACEALNVFVSFKQMTQSPFTGALHPKKQVEFFAADTTNEIPLGWLGELHPKVKRAFGLDNTDIYLFELNFDNLLQSYVSSKIAFKKAYALPKFPLLSRDFSFILGKHTTAQQIELCVQTALQDLFETKLFASLRHIQIFDIYCGEHVPENKKSVTFKVIVEPEQKTFTEQDIQIFSNSVVDAITQQLGGEQRT